MAAAAAAVVVVVEAPSKWRVHRETNKTNVNQQKNQGDDLCTHTRVRTQESRLVLGALVFERGDSTLIAAAWCGARTHTRMTQED